MLPEQYYLQYCSTIYISMLLNIFYHTREFKYQFIISFHEIDIFPTFQDELKAMSYQQLLYSVSYIRLNTATGLSIYI